MFLMDGIFLFDKSGRMLSFTLVNTDWNCSTKISAFPLESDVKFPFCFKGDTPMLSSFFTFNIFPKRFRIIIVKAFLDNRIYMFPFSMPKLFFTLALKTSISVPFATLLSLTVKSGFSLKAPLQFLVSPKANYIYFLHIF